MRPIELILDRLAAYKVRGTGPNRWRAICPVCGEKNASTLSIGVGEADQVLLRCFKLGCGAEQIAGVLGLQICDLFPPRPSAGGGFVAALHDGSIPRAAAALRRPQHKTLSPLGWSLWESCRPLEGDTLAYLSARCCVVPPADGHLRHHPALKHPSGTRGPALVALVTDAVTGQALTLHRTWVRADGSKAPLDPPRMLLGGHRKAGGVVRLWPDECVTYGLGVAEGIETALSLAHTFRPAWACLDAGNLAALPLLPGVDSLTIAADHDEAGLSAAETCAQRWVAAGREAWVIASPTHGGDLNDLARSA
jgi:putative DNA primase/helicase